MWVGVSGTSMKKASTLYDEGKYMEALEVLSKKIKPNDENAYYLKASCYYKLMQYAEAIEMYEIVIGINPNHETALLHKGLSEMHSAQYLSALSTFQKLQQITPANPQIIRYTAQLLFKLDRYQECLEWYDRALNMPPDDFFLALLYDKGCALQRLGRHDEAVEQFMKQPLDLNVASLISKSLISNNHYRKALPYLDKIIEWNPNDTDALYNKAICLQKQAIEYYQRVLLIDPNHAAALKNLSVYMNK